MTVRAQALPDQWQVEYSAGRHAGVADTQKQGAGGSAGLRPHELLEAALAACLTITTRLELAERGVEDDAGVAVMVEVIREEATTRFRYSLTLPDELATHRAAIVARLEQSPVRRTLSKTITFELNS
jgi:putative redox protein